MLQGFASIQFARLSIAATPIWINTAQYLGGSLRTRSGQQDAGAHISSLIDSIRTQLSMKVRMPASFRGVEFLEQGSTATWLPARTD